MQYKMQFTEMKMFKHALFAIANNDRVRLKDLTLVHCLSALKLNSIDIFYELLGGSNTHYSSGVNNPLFALYKNPAYFNMIENPASNF